MRSYCLKIDNSYIWITAIEMAKYAFKTLPNDLIDERERKRVKCEQPQIFKLKAWKHCAIACFFSFNFNTIIAISGYLCAHLCIVVTVTFILIYIFEKEWKKNEKKISINYWFVWSCWITVYESSSVHSLTFDFIGLQCIKCV